jgi:folate-binding protein YgfZ
MIVASQETTIAVMVEGVDARRYLHSQLSNDIANLAPGSVCHSLLLEPAGKVVALLRVACISDDEFALEFDTAVDEAVAASVVTRLSRFLIRTKATIEARIVDVVRLRSTDDEIIPESIRVMPTARLAWGGDGRAVDMVGAGRHDVEMFVAGRHDVEMVDGDVVWVDDANTVIESERVRQGWPANGREINAGETIPASLGVVPMSVSFTKGCYPGQELVERMDSRGSTAPRTLRVIDVVEGALGSELVVDGAVVGTITSRAGGRGLAFVDRMIDIGVRVSPPN